MFQIRMDEQEIEKASMTDISENGLLCETNSVPFSEDYSRDDSEFEWNNMHATVSVINNQESSNVK